MEKCNSILASSEPLKTTSKVTKNDACVLQNQVSMIKDHERLNWNDDVLYILQNLLVNIDAQGNLQKIVNLQTNVSATFSNQGFYWYAGKFLVSFFIIKNSLKQSLISRFSW